MRNIKKEIEYITIRNSILKQLEALTEQKGFLKVESDFFEEYGTYVSQNKRQDERQLVKVQDNAGGVFVLKPDITTNIIKQVLPNLSEVVFLDLYYSDTIFSIDSTGKIRPRRQFGVEVIGKDSLEADMNVITLMIHIFKMYNIDYMIEVGDQSFVQKLLELMKLSEQDSILIKKILMNKSVEELTKFLEQREITRYKDIVVGMVEFQNDIKKLTSIILDTPGAEVLVGYLERLQEMKDVLNDDNIYFDLSLLNEFDYYNGPIYRGFIRGVNQSVCRGGRYDLLTTEFGSLQPALGFSLDVDVLIEEVINNGK